MRHVNSYDTQPPINPLEAWQDTAHSHAGEANWLSESPSMR